MKKKEINKILKLRKKTKFSILSCKLSLIKKNWNFKKAIKYLRNKEKKNILDNNLKFGLIKSKINKKKNLGYVIKLSFSNDFLEGSSIIKKILNKLLLISIKKKCKDIKDLLKIKYKKNLIKDILLDKSIMFKEKIIISDFLQIKEPYIFNYNHYNNKIVSIVGFKINTKNKKKINKLIFKYIALDIITNPLFFKGKKNIKLINKYYNNKKIDKKFLELINISLKKYLYFFKYIVITNYYIKKV
ncbi:MAG: hypothetical protein NHG13_00490 [Candidatus Shikimatogenerans bostrichidophilus]|nr:MAG: hypothetical protein NHG13_00490 [Candidatus Shikimatogenerans bostrichidophilus]